MNATYGLVVGRERQIAESRVERDCHNVRSGDVLMSSHDTSRA
jgi:hypothetical protein